MTRGGALQTYEVPARENQTVLDVVTHIQRELDPSLAYRFACRVGMCGSCAMVVNGARALDLPDPCEARRAGWQRWKCARWPICR